MPQTSKFNLVEESNENYNVGVGNPIVPTFISTQKMILTDQAFYLLAFIACTVWFLRLLRSFGALGSSCFWLVLFLCGCFMDFLGSFFIMYF